jgi:hypothetical protein
MEHGIKFGEDFKPPIEKKEVNCENIKEMVEYYVNDIKKQFEEYNEVEMVNDDGSINMERFTRKNAGPYNKEEYKKEARLKRTKIRDWAMDFYKLEEDASEAEIESAINKYENLPWRVKGRNMEKLLFVHLNRMLAPNYFVMHSSDFDDLSNSVDFVIVEKKTGIVACGFDAFNSAAGSEYSEEKKDMLKNQAKRFGAKLKYGFNFKDNKIEKKQLTNLPNFYIQLTDEDIINMKNKTNMTLGGEQKPSELEEKVFSKILDSLDTQIDDYKNDDDLDPKKSTNPKVKENLKNIEEIINRFR